jgi:hypothetical protein
MARRRPLCWIMSMFIVQTCIEGFEKLDVSVAVSGSHKCFSLEAELQAHCPLSYKRWINKNCLNIAAGLYSTEARLWS